MNKKRLVSLIAMVLAIMLPVLSCSAETEEEPLRIGAISYLGMTEDEIDTYYREAYQEWFELLRVDGIVTAEESISRRKKTVYFDSLEAMLMSLMSGDLYGIRVPYYTGKYLCTTNDQLEMKRDYHPEKMTPAAQWIVDRVSDGYSFMMKEENAALLEAFNTQIKAMQQDGTLQKLIDEYIVKVADGQQPEAIAFDQFEGDPIRVAVTGSLPPMDYVNADGTFAGFNTAVMAELGKRLQKNIELVQVDSVGRALALSEGLVDVTFWTRGRSVQSAERHEQREERRQSGEKPSEEEREAKRAERQAEREAEMTEEEKAALEGYERPEREVRVKILNRDTPDGMIITTPYFTDFPVQVGMK